MALQGEQQWFGRHGGDQLQGDQGLASGLPHQLSCLVAIENDSRSEEHTSELQSLRHLVCRLLLEKKNAPPQPGPPLAGALRLRPLSCHHAARWNEIGRASCRERGWTSKVVDPK